MEVESKSKVKRIIYSLKAENQKQQDTLVMNQGRIKYLREKVDELQAENEKLKFEIRELEVELEMQDEV